MLSRMRNHDAVPVATATPEVMALAALLPLDAAAHAVAFRVRVARSVCEVTAVPGPAGCVPS